MKKLANIHVHGIEHQLFSRIEHLIKPIFSENTPSEDMISIELYAYVYPAISINLESTYRNSNQTVWETVALSENLQEQIKEILLKIFMYSFKHHLLTTWNKMKLTFNKHQRYTLERYLDKDLDMIALDNTRWAHCSHFTEITKKHILTWEGLDKNHPKPWLKHE